MRSARTLDHLDAEVLLAHVLGTDRAALHADPGRPVDPGDTERFAGLVSRRETREPVAYLIGTRGFRHLTLRVDPRVLIPRPETEHLVEVVLERAPPRARVVDVGTGSGAVALALAHERPDLRVTATDSSSGALEVARANGERLGLEVEWLSGDLLAPVTGPVDVVAANLPYVPDAESLPPDVQDHEPSRALRGGPDGLGVVRRLLDQARAPLVALEIGAGQADSTRDELRSRRWPRTSTVRDLAGHVRVVVGEC